MRVAEVIGSVVLSRRLEEIGPGRWLIVRPLALDAIAGSEPSAAEPVVAYDELNPGLGARVAISEGREAAMPFYPDRAPIDVYCAAILDHLQVEPVAQE